MTFALVVTKAPLPELWQIWARFHSTHPVKRGADLGADPIQYSPAVTRVLSLLTCQFQQGFRICVGGSGGGGGYNKYATVHSSAMLQYFDTNISPLLYVLDLIHRAKTDPCHEDGVIRLKNDYFKTLVSEKISFFFARHPRL
jgi:hypothetical protein